MNLKICDRLKTHRCSRGRLSYCSGRSIQRMAKRSRVVVHCERDSTRPTEGQLTQLFHPEALDTTEPRGGRTTAFQEDTPTQEAPVAVTFLPDKRPPPGAGPKLEAAPSTPRTQDLHALAFIVLLNCRTCSNGNRFPNRSKEATAGQRGSAAGSLGGLQRGEAISRERASEPASVRFLTRTTTSSPVITDTGRSVRNKRR